MDRGERLRAIRVAMHLTQPEFARLLEKKSFQTVSRYELGVRTVPDDIMHRAELLFKRYQRQHNHRPELSESDLAHLTEQEQRVVTMRGYLGTMQRMSLAAVGRRLGITRERARIVERQAFARLRRPVPKNKVRVVDVNA